MFVLWPRLGAAAVGLCATAGIGAAQIDYRNLDAGRPGRVADATPIERFSFELTLPYTATFGPGAPGHGGGPRLEYGLARNVAVAAGVDFGSVGEDVVSLGAFWNPFRESVTFPALAFVVDADRALGRAGGVGVSIGAIGTRSFGRSRLHANLNVAVIEAEARRWSAAIGWDYTLFRTGTLVIAELVAERSVGLEELEWMLGAGLRRQVTPTWVFHAGFSRGVAGPPNRTEVRLGLSHVFAVAALMERGAP